MDVSAIAAIAKEVRINAKAKETGNDKATLVLLIFLSIHSIWSSPRTLPVLVELLDQATVHC